MRKTLKRAVTFKGVGLHGGQAAQMVVAPAEAETGIRFFRTDLPEHARCIPARHDLVTDTRLCTKIGNGAGASLGTIEHIMAALAGLGITDAAVSVDGPEVPIMDGSASVYADAMLRAGIETLDAPLRAIRILAPISVERDGKAARLLPAPAFTMSFTITFADPAIGTQSLALDLAGETFVSELADCRTFGHLAEVEHLRKLGLARGGSLENAIVVDQGRVLNPDGLRRPDEFVRHKMLDAVGDLALAGAPIIGRYEGVKAGHELTNALLHALFAAPEAWEWSNAEAGQLPSATAVPLRPRRPVAEALAV